MKVFVPLSGGFPSQLTTAERLFPVHKSAVNSRQTTQMLFPTLEGLPRVAAI